LSGPPQIKLEALALFYWDILYDALAALEVGYG
jgi:hypothetical protein